MDEDSDIGDAKDDGSSDIMPGLADGDNLSPRSDGLGDSNDDITDFFSKHNWTSGQWIFYANLFKTNDCDELQLGLDYSEVDWVDSILDNYIIWSAAQRIFFQEYYEKNVFHCIFSFRERNQKSKIFPAGG